MAADRNVVVIVVEGRVVAGVVMEADEDGRAEVGTDVAAAVVTRVGILVAAGMAVFALRVVAVK